MDTVIADVMLTTFESSHLDLRTIFGEDDDYAQATLSRQILSDFVVILYYVLV